MTGKISRRCFNKLLGAFALFLAACTSKTLPVPDPVDTKRQNTAVRRLKDTVSQKLDFLILEDEGLEKFAEDFINKYPSRADLLNSLAPLSPDGREIMPITIKSELTEWLSKRYLMSSDFFWKGADDIQGSNQPGAEIINF